MSLANVMESTNCPFLFPEYRGYDNTEGGTYSEREILGTAEAAYQMVKAHYPTLRIVVLGTSIGTGPAAYLAGQHPLDVERVILNAPYKSLTALIGSHTSPCLASIFSHCYLPEEQITKLFDDDIATCHPAEFYANSFHDDMN